MTLATVFDLVDQHRAAYADRAALILEDTQLNYAQLADRAERLAAWLWAQGLRPGDRVAIHLHSCFEQVIATLAAARIGAVFVNVFHLATVPQLLYILEDARAHTLITSQRRARQLAQAQTPIPGTLQRIVVLADQTNNQTILPPDLPNATDWPDLAADANPLPPDALPPQTRANPDDTAALIYTSGSTGKPKGVMHSHRNIVRFALVVSGYLANHLDDRLLAVLPMSFGYGLSQYITMFCVGGAVVLQPVGAPAEIVQSLQRHNVTGLAAVAPVWIGILDYLREQPTPLPTLRYVTNAGGKLPPAAQDALPTALPGVDIYLMYGSTEAFRTTYLPADWYEQKKGSMGIPIPGVEVFVVDPDKGICGPGETGELIHRGALISQGYWQRDDQTADIFRPNEHLKHLIGDEPVLHTGDLVRVDEDGFYWFVSRRDSLIKSSGFRISPTEIEDVVSRSGLVLDVVAFGQPDDQRGQAVAIAVSPNPSQPVDEAALRANCRKNMPNYMVPTRIYTFADGLPRIPSGKLDRTAIVRDCAARVASPRQAQPDPTQPGGTQPGGTRPGGTQQGLNSCH